MKTGASDRPVSTESPKRKAPGQTAPGVMNKTEAEYAGMLELRKRAGELQDYFYDAMKVKIGAERCVYNIDFVAVLADGSLELIEVKGAHVRDDSRVKFQSAKLQYASLGRWVWAQKKKDKTWEIT